MISVALLSWKRPYHIPTIIEHLRKFDEVDEVVVCCNEFPATKDIQMAADKVLHFEKNRYTYGRFMAAAACRNDTVFVQDDDVLVNNLPTLVKAFGDTGYITANLVDDKSSKHWTWWQVNRPVWLELGFGGVFSRQQIAILQEWPYSHSLLERKADKIFTVMNPWQSVMATERDVTRLRHEGLESGRDQNALYLRDDHKQLTAEAVKLALEWKQKIRSNRGPL